MASGVQGRMDLSVPGGGEASEYSPEPDAGADFRGGLSVRGEM